MNVETDSWVRRLLILGGAMVLGMLSASVALARPFDWRISVKDHADNVNFLARDVRRELVHVASHSCLFGQMMAEVGRLEGQAAVLRGWSRHQAPLQLERKVHELAAHSDHLQSLIEEAWRRGQQGIHRPLLCTRRLQGWMAQIDAEIFAAYNTIPGVRTAFAHPQPCGHWAAVPPTTVHRLDRVVDPRWGADVSGRGVAHGRLETGLRRGLDVGFETGGGFGPGFRVEVSGIRMERPGLPFEHSGIRLEPDGIRGDAGRGDVQRRVEWPGGSRHAIGRRHADRSIERR